MIVLSAPIRLRLEGQLDTQERDAKGYPHLTTTVSSLCLRTSQGLLRFQLSGDVTTVERILGVVIGVAALAAQLHTTVSNRRWFS